MFFSNKCFIIISLNTQSRNLQCYGQRLVNFFENKCMLWINQSVNIVFGECLSLGIGEEGGNPASQHVVVVLVNNPGPSLHTACFTSV